MCSCVVYFLLQTSKMLNNKTFFARKQYFVVLYTVNALQATFQFFLLKNVVLVWHVEQFGQCLMSHQHFCFIYQKETVNLF